MISSSPSEPCTTHALSEPRFLSTCASGSTHWRENTPTICRLTPAGLESGPSRLKIVRVPSSTRVGPTFFIAGWCAGANMKPMPASSMQRATLLRRELDLDAERTQHVRRARARGERAVAVLGDRNAGARHDEGRAGRDVVGARRIAAGADHVDRVGGRGDAQHLLAHGGDRAGDFLDGLAAHAQRHQEAAHLRRRGLARHHAVEAARGLFAAQRGAGRRLGDQSFEVIGHIRLSEHTPRLADGRPVAGRSRRSTPRRCRGNSAG